MGSIQIRITQKIILVLACVSVALFVHQSVRNFNKPAGNDLTVYLEASEELYAGVNPYHEARLRFVYPLFLVVVIYPLTFLAQSVLAKQLLAGAWALLSFFAFFWTIRVTTDRLKIPWHTQKSQASSAPRWLLFALMVVALHPFLQDEFLNSQINLIVIGFVALYFILLESKHSALAALALGVAAAIKLAPAILIIYALVQRRYLAVISFCIIVPLLVVGIPLLVAPDALLYYSHYFNEVTASLTSKEATFGYRSFSLLSTVTHTFDLYLPTGMRIALTGALVALFTLPVFLFFRRQTHGLTYEQRFLAFAVIVSVVPLVFPMSESHHLLILCFPLIAALTHFRKILLSERSLLHDISSRILLFSFGLLHLGQALKTTPLRFIGLMGIYFGLLYLLRCRVSPLDEKG